MTSGRRAALKRAAVSRTASATFALVGARELERAVPREDLLGHRDAALDHVAMDLEIARALLAPDRLHHLVHGLGGGADVVEQARRAGELAVDAQLRLDLLRLVVDQRAELALLVARTAAQHQQRHALGERSRDRVHHVVSARAVGDAHDADATGRARVAVGGEADARLVRQRHDAEPAARAEAQEEPQHEIAGDAEEMRDPDLAEVGDQEVAERHRGLHGDRSPARGTRRRTPRRRPTRRSPGAPRCCGTP